jgi:tetratricopeptide (TPR) repeat protein
VLAALDTAAGGQGRLLLLAGDPGVGKTRLAQEVALHAQTRGFHVLAGRCYEQYAAVPFFPFVEVLTNALGLASPTLLQETPHRFPYLGRLVPDLLTGPPTYEGEDARPRLLRAVSGFLAALAAEAPVALLVDDLHWADSASLELLTHLARQAPGQRILLVGLFREVEVNRQHPLEATLAELARDRLLEEIHLRDLSASGTAALIGAYVGHAEVAAELRDLIHGRTGGNPFFTEEVLKALDEQGALVRTGEAGGRGTLEAIAVPRSVRSVVGQRVGRLPAAAQETLRVASILGQEWELEVLIGATGQDEDAVLAALDAALAARLLEERQAGRGERYAFAHALIGQALYDEVPRHRLRRLHLRVGTTLERVHGEQREASAELARHFLAAGDAERAIRHALRAGDYAAGLYAHAEAAQQYGAALELLEEAGDEAGAARVREKLGDVLRRQGRYEAALEMLEPAAAIWQAGEDWESLARVLVVMSSVHAQRGTPRAGLERVQPWVGPIEALASPSALAALYEALAYLYFNIGQYGNFLDTIERAVAQARTVQDAHALARVTMHHGNALQMVGRVEESLRITAEAIHLAEVTDDQEFLCAALLNTGYNHMYRGEFALREPFVRRGLDVAERMGDPYWIATQSGAIGWLHFHLGRWDAARQSLDRILDIRRETPVAAFPLLGLGILHMVTGAWEEAADALDEAVAHFTPIDDYQGLREASQARAELDLLQGQAEAARARLEPLLDRPGLEEFDVTEFLPELAWAYLELGHLDQAEHTVEQALRRARAEQLRLILVDALRVQALIALRQERWDEAIVALEEGLALARDMPYPHAEARLLHVYGEMHVQKGERGPARERLEAALAIFQRLGARKDAERVAQAIGDLPARG